MTMGKMLFVWFRLLFYSVILTLISSVSTSIGKEANSKEFQHVSENNHEKTNEPVNEMENKFNATKMNWVEYHNYDVVMDYARGLSHRFAFVTYESIGVSTEGRDIGLVRIGSGNKPGIFLDGGIHAAEWISVATVTYVMDKIVSSPDLLDLFDFYIVPMINVDGYQYTFTTDRRWRKTRSINSGKEGETCEGVDANRNFDFHWGETGASDDPCSKVYRGPVPFSEPETSSLAKKILSLKDKLKMYISFHSWGQFILLPWGYSEESKPSDYEELLRMANVGVAALKATHGTEYVAGTSYELVWAAAGSSYDWAKGVAGIKYSYVIELPPVRNSSIGYFLPPNQIIPTSEEIFNAVSAMAHDLYKQL